MHDTALQCGKLVCSTGEYTARLYLSFYKISLKLHAWTRDETLIFSRDFAQVGRDVHLSQNRLRARKS